MRKSYLLFFFVFITLFWGCSSKVILTQDMLYNYDILSANNIQYYVSNRIDLMHEEKIENNYQADGMLKGSSKIIKDHVFVEPETPGIAVEYADDFDYIWVSFERGSKFKFKWDPDKDIEGCYCLYTDKQLTFEERIARPGALGMYIFKYNNKDYYANSIKDICLIIESGYLEEIDTNQHRLKGRKVKSSKLLLID